MSLFISSLNSGSNGNCYYVASGQDAILVDAGISCLEIEKRLKRLGTGPENIRAVFISHEHTDHIRGLTLLSRRYNLPVYITPGTARGGRLHLDKKLMHTFRPHDPVPVGDLTITAFPKAHDAADPYSFVVSHQSTHVGVFTDIGTPCAHLTSYFSQCTAAFLEANYDEEMLTKGSYPVYLKNRIRGGRGHLSNRQALELFREHRADHLSHLFLSHLSQNNNCPKLVQELFDAHAGSTRILVASRFQESPLYEVRHEGETDLRTAYRHADPPQLEFSFD